MKLNELKIDKTWTLFLDRDGVINLHYPNDYVKTWDEFFFLEDSLAALKMFSSLFKRIIIVTNQQGVGKNVMTEDDLQLIHDEMLKEVRKYGGRIHAIYSATELLANDLKGMRKPAIGMAKQAKKDFPEIDFQKSMMIGDTLSDMQFGRTSGMTTVFVGDASKLSGEQAKYIDFYCENLSEVAHALLH